MSAATTSMEVGGATQEGSTARQRFNGRFGKSSQTTYDGPGPEVGAGSRKGRKLLDSSGAIGINSSGNDVRAGYTGKGSASWGRQPAREG